MSGDFRWGLLGVSGIVGDKFLPGIRDSATSRAEVIASRSLDRARAFADESGIPRAVGSYEELLADPDIDAVYISVPNTLHTEWIIKALEAGKPVLCEKPMLIDAAEGRRVLEASRRTGVPVMEGFMWRFHPRTLRLKELLDQGAIGEVREVRSHFSFPLAYVMSPDNIRVSDGRGAGALMDVGSYVVSSVRLLFGREPIEAVGFWDESAELGTDVGFSGSLDFGDRRFATIAWSLRGGYGAGYTVVGSEGSLEVPHGFIPGAGDIVDESWIVQVSPTFERTVHTFAPTNHFASMIDAFATAVATGDPVPYGAEDALANAEALDLVRRAVGIA